MDKFNHYLQSMMNLLGEQPYLQVATIVTVSYLLAKIISIQLVAFLHRLFTRFNSPLGRELSGLLKSPLFFLVFINGSMIATRYFPFSQPIQTGIAAALKSILIIMIAAFVLRLTKLLLNISSKDRKHFPVIQQATLPLFENIAVILIAVAAVHQVFSAWDVSMTALLASAGIVGLALGMAAKDVLADVYSGVFILTDGPYKLGDFIVVDKETQGTVSRIGIRNTRIVTRDNVEVILPNALIGNSKVVNRSSGPEGKYRVRINLGIPYGSDLDKVLDLLSVIGKNCSDSVCETPAAKAVVTELGESRIELLLLCWVSDPTRRMSVVSAANQAIYKKFTEERIEFGFARQEIAIKEMAPAKQEISINELPIGRQVVHISDMPDLFARKNR